MKEEIKINNEIVDKRINELTQYVNQSLLLVEAKHASFTALCLVLVSVIFEHFIGKHSCVFMKYLIAITTITLLASMSISIFAIYPRERKKRKNKKGTLSILEKNYQKIKKFSYSKKDTGNKKKYEIHYLFRCEDIESSSNKIIMRIISEGIEGYKFSDFDRQRIDKIMGVAKSASRKYRLFRRAICCFGFFIIEFITLIILKQL
ncbi:MAG: hypothetical protein Q3992_02510 [Bacteroides sp.]|nr:hypothetical protein [Bacteroides sp.]